MNIEKLVELIITINNRNKTQSSFEKVWKNASDWEDLHNSAAATKVAYRRRPTLEFLPSLPHVFSPPLCGFDNTTFSMNTTMELRGFRIKSHSISV